MLIIWDVDGTIADAWPLYKAACINVTSRLNLPLPDEKLLRHGFGHHELLDYGWKGTLEEQNEIRLKIYAEYYELAKTTALPAFSWVKGLLQQYQEYGHTHAIATNRPLKPTEDFLHHQNIRPHFSQIVHGDMADAGQLRFKPEPDMLLCILDTLGYEKSNAVFLGDTESDALAAQRAHVEYIAVCWGMRDEAYLKSYSPQHLVRTPSELHQVLKTRHDRASPQPA